MTVLRMLYSRAVQGREIHGIMREQPYRFSPCSRRSSMTENLSPICHFDSRVYLQATSNFGARLISQSACWNQRKFPFPSNEKTRSCKYTLIYISQTHQSTLQKICRE